MVVSEQIKNIIKNVQFNNVEEYVEVPTEGINAFASLYVEHIAQFYPEEMTEQERYDFKVLFENFKCKSGLSKEEFTSQVKFVITEMYEESPEFYQEECDIQSSKELYDSYSKIFTN